MKRIFILMLAVAMLVFCGASAMAAPTRAETLVIGTTGDATTIDPHASNSMWSNNITINVFDPLVR